MMPALSNVKPLPGALMASKSAMTGLVPEALAVVAHVCGLATLPPAPAVAVPAVPLPVPPDDVPAVALLPAVLALPPLDVPAVPLSSGSSFTQPTNRPLETSTAANAE
jgi:hypothetical protein